MAVLDGPGGTSVLRYLRWVAGTLVVLAVAVAGFAAVVDPFYVFGAPLVAGFNRVKPEAATHALMAKPALLPRVCPATLLLGNSRIEVGINPDSPAWPEADQPVFNGAAAAAGPDFALEMLALARRTCPPRLVVLGVDFTEFLSPPEEGAPVSPPPPPSLAARLGDLAVSTLTLDGASAAVSTLVHQLDPFSATITPRGFDPLHEYDRIARWQGYHRLFAAKLDGYAALLRASPYPALTPQRNAALRTVAEIVAQAGAMHARIVLVIQPYHVTYLDLVRTTGRWQTFLEWKQALAELVARAAATGVAVRLADFSTLPETHEPIPPPGDLDTVTKFYWESGHYKAALGDRMIPNLTAPDS